ncbi:MAG: hypothetical protein LBK52_07100 [Deltaproteobacteria bacterium]|nr:hypothetical protein [Deltaproteobacteria bacterium]
MPPAPKKRRPAASAGPQPLGGAALKALLEKLDPLSRRAAAELNLAVVSLETPLESGRRIVRITAEQAGAGPEAGITIEECARLARRVSAALDEIDSESGPAYVLEVSSPGLDRRLETEADFRRFDGRRCRLKMIQDGRRRTASGFLATAAGPLRLLTPDGGEIVFEPGPDLKARLIPEL